MADILHDFWIKATPERVFELCATARGLEAWWTRRAAGEPRLGAEYQFYFSEDYDWRGVVMVCEPGRAIEWELRTADADWVGTRVGFALAAEGEGTRVAFHHAGWREPSQHFRVSSYCWATYLRLMKRHVEHGETVAYDLRDEA